ncbi:Rossmann-like and DUF2520 domain-containing protein [Roseivirga sp. BDSF3-8]|uniref:Rossmann-like and DUF2520 domain-containing protein n=1 Tax=Roseivirga sp. BDSF3-8 TaxID=3241598 RepID=UPI0035318E14
MAGKYELTIIGAGNLAWHVAPAFERLGHVVREVYSRDIRNAEKLATRLESATPVESLDFSESTARIFLIASSDDAVPELVSRLILPERALLAHTSGALSIDVLDHPGAWARGVFYPIQTFSKEKDVNFEGIPVCIEATNEEAEEYLINMAHSISKKVYRVESRDRLSLHVAAVFACNFTNHMLRASAEILQGQDLKLDMLKPLIRETLNNSLEISPEKAQTGPARRGDRQTIAKHMDFLNQSPDKARLYKLISEDILQTYTHHHE